MGAARIVLVGCGHLGRYHLHKLVADPMADLVAVVEPDAAQADRARQQLTELAGGAKTQVVRALQDVTEAADACIVATPTRWHEEVVLACLARNWHVLVEKPMATDAEAAGRMVAAAQRAQRILQVGHLERFNPAIEAAMAEAGPVRYFVAERLGPFTGRATDVDVVLDLMIHDLDLLMAFVDAPLREVRAVGMPVLTETIDMAAARIELGNGTVAQLSAGRTSLRPSRKLRLFSAAGYLSVDCAEKTVSMVRRHSSGANSHITGGALTVPIQDALAAQDHAFVLSVTNGAPVRVDAAAGLRAMQLADAVKQAMARHAQTHAPGLGFTDL